MSKPKYKRGKLISSIADFGKSECKYFKVLFGKNEKTMHRSWIESWQYHMFDAFVKQKRVYEAVLIDEEGEHSAD